MSKLEWLMVALLVLMLAVVVVGTQQTASAQGVTVMLYDENGATSIHNMYRVSDNEWSSSDGTVSLDTSSGVYAVRAKDGYYGFLVGVEMPPTTTAIDRSER